MCLSIHYTVFLAMQVLEEHEAFITSRVKTLNILDDLHSKTLLYDHDYEHIKEQVATVENPIVNNRSLFRHLLTTIKDYKDHGGAAFGICDFILEKYPNVSIHIPAIQARQRMLVNLSPKTILTVSKIGEETEFDIRRIVSIVFFIFFCTMKIHSFS